MSHRVQPLMKSARDAHPGIALRFGTPVLADIDDDGAREKYKTASSEWIKAVVNLCGRPESQAFSPYRLAYTRWEQLARSRGATRVLALKDRMQIGLGAASVLET